MAAVSVAAALSAEDSAAVEASQVAASAEEEVSTVVEAVGVTANP